MRYFHTHGATGSVPFKDLMDGTGKKKVGYMYAKISILRRSSLARSEAGIIEMLLPADNIKNSPVASECSQTRTAQHHRRHRKQIPFCWPHGHRPTSYHHLGVVVREILFGEPFCALSHRHLPLSSRHLLMDLMWPQFD